jgi:uncharacterized protein YjbI with pentapeptide repeats
VPLIVKDRDGNFLVEVEGTNFLDEKDLRRANFSGQVLQGIHIDDSDLREADFTDADLYWAYAFRANCEGAIFQNAKLNGATLAEANFRGADLRGADLSLDNLGGATDVKGANFTGALLEGTIFTGCQYDDSTIFPEDFDPAAHGMIWVDPERIYIRPGSFASATLSPRYYVPDRENPGSYIPWKKN